MLSERFVALQGGFAARRTRLLELATWAFFLLRAIYAFGPAGANVTFNSDSAIPVLMSVDETPITLFNFYYYGTDRWGAWPFLLTQLVRHATGFQWSAESVSALQAFWVFAGSLTFAALSRRDAPLVALAYTFALCLHREARFLPFQLSQLYGWQIGALLLAWLGLRRLFEPFLGGSPAAPRRIATTALATVFWTYLAVSSSVSSTPFLLALLAVEFARGSAKLGRPAFRQLVKPSLLGLGTVLVGSLAERLQKAAYHAYSQRQFGHAFETHFAIDRGNLATNFAKAAHNLGAYSWWPLYFVPLVAGLAWALALVYVRGEGSERARRRLRGLLTDDTAYLVLGGSTIAVLNFAVVVVVNHVRLNDYDDRYLTITNLFGPACGLLTLLLVLRVALKEAPIYRRIEQGFALGLGLVLLVAFPARGTSGDFAELTRTAGVLSHQAPNGFLLGSYWDTYVFSALQPTNPLTPVPFQGEENRMPWSVGWLRKANAAIVALPLSGKGSRPPERMDQYGVSFALADARWYEDSAHRFAKYTKVAAGEAMRRSYGASELQLAACAHVDGDDIVAENCESGFVVFGPYASVPADSDVEFSFEIDAPRPFRVFSEIISEAGKTSYASVPERPVVVGQRHWSGLRVHLFNAVDKLESRIRVRGDGPLSFRIHELKLSIE